MLFSIMPGPPSTASSAGSAAPCCDLWTLSPTAALPADSWTHRNTPNKSAAPPLSGCAAEGAEGNGIWDIH